MTYVQNLFRVSTVEMLDILDSMADFDRSMARKANQGNHLARALYDFEFEKKVDVVVANREQIIPRADDETADESRRSRSA